MPFSAKLGTPLSNFEASENYKDVDDPSLVISFQSRDEPNTYFLAWTTTPWTLVSNLALMVGPLIEYVEVLDHASKRHYILANSRLNAYYKDSSDYTLIRVFPGTELEGKRYISLFDYFIDQTAKGALSRDFRRFYLALMKEQALFRQLLLLERLTFMLANE